MALGVLLPYYYCRCLSSPSSASSSSCPYSYAFPVEAPFSRAAGAAPLSFLPSPVLRKRLLSVRFQSKKENFPRTSSPGKGHNLLKVESKATESTLQSMEDRTQDDECELVNGCDISLGEGDEAFDGYFVTALKNNNKAAILLLTDVYGYKDQDNRDFAYRLACFGYNVLVPDLFRGLPWDKGRPTEEYEKWRMSHASEDVTRHVELSTTWLKKEIDLGNLKTLGMIGFCFGGGCLMEALARDSDGLIRSGVCFYGTRFDPSLAANIQVPVLFIVGDKDRLCPLELVQSVEKIGSSVHIRVYKGRGHAFAHRPQSSDEDEDAEDAFHTARHWLSEHLLPKST